MECAMVERFIKMRRESQRKASTASNNKTYGNVYQHVSLTPSPCLPTAQLNIEAKVRVPAE